MVTTINRLDVVEDLTNFGESSVAVPTDIEYFGQTFVAEGSRLNSISFKIDSTTGPDATEFKFLLVTTAPTANGFHPGSVLFESSVLVQPTDGDNAYQIVTIDLGSLPVTPGQQYAFLLDAFATKDGSDGLSQLGASFFGSTGSAYAGQHFVTLDADAGTRATHFAADWTDWNGGESTNVDLAFSAVFSDPPVITSQGGGSIAFLSVTENGKTVTDVDATDPDNAGPTYSIAGGSDAAKFTIDAATGVLSFVDAPDFEKPTDAGANNVYDVAVKATDTEGNSDIQSLHVTVTDEAGVTIIGKGGKDKVDATNAPDGQQPPTAFEDVVFGNGGNDKLSGLAGFDLVDGGKGNDTVRGGDGDDWLVGGKGKDKLFGEVGADSFVFNTSLKETDKIGDFSVLDDTIVLSQSMFKALDLGVLGEASFHLGAKAADQDDHILYAGNKLRYDQDGAGGSKAVTFATLDKGLAMTHLDFEVVA
jgi:Ca2+-binding RTX toxin-like protein